MIDVNLFNFHNSGNCVDVTLDFPDFLEKTGINKGIIIGDKGINSSALMSNVGFIHPLKRPLKLLEEIDAYNMKDKINSKDEPTWCKKIFHNGLYYYAFRNLKRASKEEQDFMSSKKFSIERYEKLSTNSEQLYMYQIKISPVKMH